MKKASKSEFLRRAQQAMRACECDGETDRAVYWKTEKAADGVWEAFFRDSANIYCVRDEPGAQPFACCAR